ncbi:hypothetical protein GCM10010187_28400 [Actinomadura coerulea]|nr:hypothetical protein GCM10010187_28400 [Actinomadura coerulea]
MDDVVDVPIDVVVLPPRRDVLPVQVLAGHKEQTRGGAAEAPHRPGTTVPVPNAVRVREGARPTARVVREGGREKAEAAFTGPRGKVLSTIPAW